MKVEAVIHQHQHVHQPGGRGRVNPEAEISEPLALKDETSASSYDSIPSSEAEEKNTEAARGVIRLLQEGHFKGVAEVRLRINFFDELSEIEARYKKRIADEEIDDVFQSVNSVLRSPEVPESPSDAVIDTFQKAVSQAKEDFLAAELPSMNTLVSDLESAFESFITSLVQPLTSTDNETSPSVDTAAEGSTVINTEMKQNNVSEQNLPASGELEKETPAFDLIDALRTTFSAAMDELTNKLSTSNVLPELSAPKGNGGAYDKFLAIYNDLQESRVSEDTTQEPDLLDITV